MFGLPEISVSCAGFASPSAPSPRALLDAVSSLGVRGIALDAAAPGMRPRELSRSARRDVAATLRRLELELSGIDLWIPPHHFSDPATSPRAIEATMHAIEMSAELATLVGGRSRPVVSLTLPEDLPDSARVALGDAGAHHGATLADHALTAHEGDLPAGMGVGIDPVFSLTDGQSPAKAVTRAGADLASARLCDTNAMGRCPVGAPGSKLDVTGYAGAMIVSGLAWITLDLRGLEDPAGATELASRAWHDAGTI